MAATRSLSTEIGIKPACAAFGLARSGFYRGQAPAKAPAPRPSPPRTLSSEERQAVLATLHSDRFVDQAPTTIYATLLDEGATTAPSAPCTASWTRHRRGQGAPRTSSATRLHEARTARDRPQSGLVVGHHEAARSGEVDLLPSLRDPRHLQPLRRRLDARRPRESAALAQRLIAGDLREAGRSRRAS